MKLDFVLVRWTWCSWVKFKPLFSIIGNSLRTFFNIIFPLFLLEIYSGSNTNQSKIVSGDTGTYFGETAVNNWAIYEGIGQDAKVVAHAKGLHVKTIDWYNSFNMVFDGERFKGSTLQVMGATIGKLGDWSIVGGTGAFELARGVIKRKVHEEGNGKIIYGLTIHGFCAMPLEEPIKNGPWGRTDVGSARELTKMPQRLESVTITYSGAIDAFSYTYIDQSGQKQTVGPWGSKYVDGATKIKTVTLDPSEFLREISGEFEPNNNSILHSVTFVSNIRTYGPFGRINRTQTPKGPVFKFNVDDVNKRCIVGFYGTTDNNIRSLGVYTI